MLMLIFIHVYVIIISKGGINMNERPKIKDSKCRFNITIDKQKKIYLEGVAEELGMSLNNLFISSNILYLKYKFPKI